MLKLQKSVVILLLSVMIVMHVLQTVSISTKKKMQLSKFHDKVFFDYMSIVLLYMVHIFFYF